MPRQRKKTPFPPGKRVGPGNVPSNTALQSRIRGPVMDSIISGLESGRDPQISAAIRKWDAAIRSGVANIDTQPGDIVMEIVAGAAYPDDM